VTTEQMQERLSEVRNQGHERCVVCAPSHPLGLRVEYHADAGGVVHAEFPCHRVFQVYRGQLHGGVIAALLDGAMTNCLFAQGVEAVTGELTVRFLRPVKTDHVADVSARLSRVSHRLYILEAEVIQEQVPVARAQGKFLQRSVGRGTRAA
jgi:uncharacterized protein (TIGR00369 family)